MKYTWIRQIEYNSKPVDVKFEYWPSTPDSRTQPGDPSEINILSITDLDGKNISVPDVEDDGGDGTNEKLVELLFDVL